MLYEKLKEKSNVLNTAFTTPSRSRILVFIYLLINSFITMPSHYGFQWGTQKTAVSVCFIFCTTCNSVGYITKYLKKGNRSTCISSSFTWWMFFNDECFHLVGSIFCGLVFCTTFNRIQEYIKQCYNMNVFHFVADLIFVHLRKRNCKFVK